MLELCCDKNVATFFCSAGTKIKANGSKVLSRHSNLREKKECCDTKKLCYDKKCQIKETSQVKLITTKVLMLRQTFQRMKSSRHDICRDISNQCRDIM